MMNLERLQVLDHRLQAQAPIGVRANSQVEGGLRFGHPAKCEYPRAQPRNNEPSSRDHFLTPFFCIESRLGPKGCLVVGRTCPLLIEFSKTRKRRVEPTSGLMDSQLLCGGFQ